MIHKPRLNVHDDDRYVSIGFDDTQDTILRVGGQPGDPGEGDVARVREWSDAVNRLLGVDLIGFLVTDFEGHYPVGTSAIVYAEGREQAKRILRDKLREQGLGRDDPDEWTLEPITPPPSTPRARVIQNGDY